MRSAESKRLDMLHGPIWSKLPQFALPVAATAILEQLFNASDIAVVGNFTGADKTIAVAAVGANSALIALIVNLFIGIALGANVVIANAVGRGDREAVQKAVHTSIVFSLLGGIVVAVLGELAAAALLRTLHVPDDVFPQALLYLRIYLMGMPVILLYNFEAAIFRSVGETRVPLVALAMSGVLNVLLNLFFVAVLHMTVNGVAIATVMANAFSSALLFRRLLRSGKDIRLEPRKLRMDGRSLWMILRIGLPAGLQSAVFAISNIVIQSAINSLGKVVMAASSAACNIEVFAYDVMNSYNQACTTFVGQNYGARSRARIQESIRTGWLLHLGMAVFFSAVAVLSSPLTMRLFSSDPAVLAEARQFILHISSCYVLFSSVEVLSSSMRGVGNAVKPAVITFFAVCALRMALLFTVTFPHLSVLTISICYPVTWAASSVLFILYYKFGRWMPRYPESAKSE